MCTCCSKSKYLNNYIVTVQLNAACELNRIVFLPFSVRVERTIGQRIRCYCSWQRTRFNLVAMRRSSFDKQRFFLALLLSPVEELLADNGHFITLNILSICVNRTVINHFILVFCDGRTEQLLPLSIKAANCRCSQYL